MEFRLRIKEPDRCGGLGTAQHFGGKAGFTDLSVIHYDHPRGDLPDDVNVVRDEQEGRSPFAVDVCQELQYLG